MTPIGLMNIGVGSRIPNKSIDISRLAAPTNIRGISPQRSNADTLMFCVCSFPQPPGYQPYPAGAAMSDDKTTKWRKERGISAEVWAARPYEVFTDAARWRSGIKK